MSSPRSAMIAKIHVAKKHLALSEESYRDVLLRVTQLDSTGRMTERQLESVLKEFVRLGFKPTTKRTGTSKQAQIRMIHAVFADIVKLGGVEAEGPETAAAALRAFVVRQTKTKANPQGISDAKFLDSTSANKVLEGLKGWRTRLRQKRAEAA